MHEAWYLKVLIFAQWPRGHRLYNCVLVSAIISCATLILCNKYVTFSFFLYTCRGQRQPLGNVTTKSTTVHTSARGESGLGSACVVNHGNGHLFGSLSHFSIRCNPHSQSFQGPYLLSEGQNMYNRVVLVYTVNVYIPASLGRWPILRYQVLQVPKKIVLTLLTVWGLNVSCREYCRQFEINNARHLLSTVFIARHFKYRKQKIQPYLQSEDWFLRKL